MPKQDKPKPPRAGARRWTRLQRQLEEDRGERKKPPPRKKPDKK